MVTSPKKGFVQVRLRSNTTDKAEFLRQLKEAGFCFGACRVNVFRVDDLALQVQTTTQG